MAEMITNPLAKRILVRGSDGRLHVQFIDIKTGKRISDKDISKYDFWSANENDWNSRSRTKPTDENKTDEVSDYAQIRLTSGDIVTVSKEWLKSHPDVNVVNDNYWPPGTNPDETGTDGKTSTKTDSKTDKVDKGGTPSARTINKTVGATPPGFTTPAATTDQTDSQPEQGDTTDDSGFSNLPKATYDPNSESVTGQTVRSVDYPSDQVNTTYDGTTTPADAKKNENGFYTTGKNFHELEGTDLSKVNGITAQRMKYSESDIEDMAKTLAGEIDQRYTDVNSDEGKKEIGGILSTIEKRSAATNKSIHDIAYAPGQYSAHNEAMKQRTKENYDANPEGWKQAVRDHIKDPGSFQDVSFYRNPKEANPNWAAHEVDPVTYGPHQFSNLDTNEYALPDGFLDGLTKEEQGIAAGKLIDRNALQSFAAPASIDIAGTPPTTGFYSTDMAAGINAQRDYTPDNSLAAGMNAQRDYTPDSSLAAGLNAQRDYTGDDTGFTTADVDKSSRFAPTDVSQTRMPGFNESNETSFAAGMNAQRNEIDSGLVDGLSDAGAIGKTTRDGLSDAGAIGKTTRDGFTAADITKSGRFSTPSIAPEDMDRFTAPSVNDQANATNFDAGMQAQRDYTAKGFGDYVKEDQSVDAPSNFSVDPTGSINNTADTAWSAPSSTGIADSPPSFAGIQNEAEAAKDTGMNSETNNSTTDGVSDTGPGRDGEGFSGEPGGEAPSSSPTGTSPDAGADGFSTNTNTGESKPDSTSTSSDSDSSSDNTGGSGGGFTSAGDDGVGGWDGYI